MDEQLAQTQGSEDLDSCAKATDGGRTEFERFLTHFHQRYVAAEDLAALAKDG